MSPMHASGTPVESVIFLILIGIHFVYVDCWGCSTAAKAKEEVWKDKLAKATAKSNACVPAFLIE